MSRFAFHPELFEHRTLALEALDRHGYCWLEDFSAVDLLHEEFGLEVCGLAEEADAEIVLLVLQETFPNWSHADLRYSDRSRELGWKVVIYKTAAKSPRHGFE